jgi:hypothetical protein
MNKQTDLHSDEHDETHKAMNQFARCYIEQGRLSALQDVEKVIDKIDCFDDCIHYPKSRINCAKLFKGELKQRLAKLSHKARISSALIFASKIFSQQKNGLNFFCSF